ncbi:PP2C family protein-serine/threonine phosphatase [Gordonia soli]|uniref:Putative serine/threonine protein phosphatase n=1 Tax=Gordonia soli NBRC 108243 TaxID=1223545 RepID=M0QK73_9ACTN|nr:protein phosphatase 2C domain-containing protein [Gordonia soli]GAC68844.1 putative serine/threonine protein phosphatase [Gordonia soli NBRC 108243]
MNAATIVRDASRSGTDILGDLRLEWSVACNVGRVRETNEDAALALPGRYLLADGMGGHDSGELASEAALLTLADVEASVDQGETQAALIDLLSTAQTKIGEISTESERRAGTTATGLVLVTHEGRPHWLVLNIGDSRTYRYQAGVLEQLTIDHSQVQEFVDAGFITKEQARVDPRRNVITRALGAGMVEPQADFFSFEALPGDLLLVCSDGLTGELPDEEIEGILADSPDSEVAAEALVDAALGLGAHDNVTVIVVAVHDSVSTAQVAVPDADADRVDADAGTTDEVGEPATVDADDRR